MVQIDPAYQLALADMMIGICSFLGGFSATIFVTLLTLAKPSIFARIAIGASAFAAVAFIICLTSAVSISFALHPAAPTSVRDAPLDHLQITMAASFILGIAAMLGSIGISGWIRSRALGVFTSVIAAIGLLMAFGQIG
tara:strand:+ start:1470 stop:1886 length:417 start_codon:yes stop_codon:yes gene_type:complete